MMADFTYVEGQREIYCRNGRLFQFKHPISEVVQFENYLVVRVWPPRGTIFNENIFGVDLAGSTLWQIEPQYPSTEENGVFCALEKIGEYAVVSNIKNLVLYLDPVTGKVVKKYHQMR